MSNPFGLPSYTPEQMAAQQRYSNWLHAVQMGWTTAKEMNCRDKDKFPAIAKELADKYFSHLNEGEKLLEMPAEKK